MFNLENISVPKKTADLKNKDFEMLYWSVMIGCTSQELARAMTGVGASDSQVKIYLKTKKFSLKYSA